MNKYNYFKVIQSCNDGVWSDESFYPTDSSFSFKTKEERNLLREDLKNYRESTNAPYRVVTRRELNTLI